MQRPDLPQLESGPHFMTAVCVRVDHIRRKYDRWQNPKGSARVYAWAYSSGHCRISHQVSLWIAFCSLAANCVTVMKIDGTQVGYNEATMSLNIWQTRPSDFHIIGWDEWERVTQQRFGVFSWAEGEWCGLKPVCPALNTLQWSADCMPAS